jgi:prevent-host-death family protein
MANIINIHAAKTHFSKLIVRVEAGEEIIIGRAGEPVAKLVPVAHPAAEPKPDRIPGLLRGQIKVADNFDDPLPEELMAYFRGERD